MMTLVYFLIAFFASTIGALSGIGGGVIIKPVMDSLGAMSVASVSFLSGCTVLVMSGVSVLRSRRGGMAIEKGVTVFLALGACAGGFAGKAAFQALETAFDRSDQVGIVQAALLLAVNIGVFVYLRMKEKLAALRVRNRAVCTLIGLGLGMLSAFLGIGGGPINIAVLAFFFSMTPKQTAVNSLFIILCSQSTSLCGALISGTVPAFPWAVLPVMAAGGVAGALVGGRLLNKLDDEKVHRLFSAVLVLLIALNVYNIVRFSL